MSYKSFKVPKRKKVPPTGYITHRAKYISCSIDEDTIINNEKKYGGGYGYDQSLLKNDIVYGVSERFGWERSVITNPKLDTKIIRGDTVNVKSKRGKVIMGINDRDFEIEKNKENGLLNIEEPYNLAKEVRVQIEGIVNMVYDGSFIDLKTSTRKRNEFYESINESKEVDKKKITITILDVAERIVEFLKIDKKYRERVIEWDKKTKPTTLEYIQAGSHFKIIPNLTPRMGPTIFEVGGIDSTEMMDLYMPQKYLQDQSYFNLIALNNAYKNEPISFYCYH
jgi:hypothetical protein